MKTKILLFTLLLSLASFAQVNYYVSPTGNDLNDGSLANPWKTVQFAAQNSNIVAGDTVNVMAGTYNEEVTFEISGAADFDITFRNYQNDEVILSGANLPAYEYIIKIEEQHHLRISGMKIQDYQQLDAIGLLIINSSYIYIEDNEFSNIDYSANAVGQTPNEQQNSQPIIVFGRKPNNVDASQGIEILRNKIHDCETGWSESVSINGNIDGFEVAYNEIYDNTNIAIVAIGYEGECSNPDNDQARNGNIHHNLVHDNPSAYAECAGIYIDGAAYMNIENNILYNNDYGIEIGCENNGGISGANANNIIAQNNVIYNNKYTGIALGGYDYPTSGFVEYAIIRNNSLFNNDTENNYQGEMMISYTKNSVIENNIFYTMNTDNVLFTLINPNNTLNFNYNLFYTASNVNNIVIEWNGTEYNSFADYQTGTSQDANSMFSNPVFVDNSVTNPDLHIQETSPAINAGNPSSIPDGSDMDSENRINGGRVDIGADEYFSSSSVKSLSNQDKLCIFPNPATNNLQFTISNEQLGKSIQVLDITGKVLKQFRIQNSELKIQIGDLENGIYFIKAGNQIKKFIKE